MLNYDQTGQSPDNLVFNEIHTLNTSVAIWPVEGVFYLESLNIRGELISNGVTVPLIQDVDYLLSPMLISRSIATAMEVYSYILIINHNTWTNITIDYQGSGLDVDKTLKAEVDASSYDPLLLSDYLDFKGESAILDNSGNPVSPDSISWLELVNGGMDTLITQLQQNVTSSIESEISANANDNVAQSILISKLLASDASQLLKLKDLERRVQTVVVDSAELDAINDAQDVDIASNASGLATIKTNNDLNTTKNGEQDVLIQANTDSNASQDILIAASQTKLDSGSVEIDGFSTSSTLGISNLTDKKAIVDANVSEVNAKVNSQTTTIAANTNELSDKDALITALTGGSTDNATLITEQSTSADSITSRISTNISVNTQQDIDIAINRSATDALIATGIGGTPDLTTLNSTISTNTSTNGTQDILISGNQITESPQNLEIVNINNRITVLEGVDNVGALAIVVAAQDANDLILATLSTGEAANTTKNITQDGLLDGMESAVGGLGGGEVVNLTVTQAAIDVNDTKLLSISTVSTYSVGFETYQDDAITDINSRTLALENTSAVVTTPVTDITDATAILISSLESATSANEVINVTQDSRIAGLEADRTTLLTRISDYNPNTVVIDTSETKATEYTGKVTDLTNRQAAQRVIIDEITNKIATYNPADPPSTTELEAIIVANAATIAGQVTTIAGFGTTNTSQDSNINSAGTTNDGQDTLMDAMEAELGLLGKAGVPAIFSNAYPIAGDTLLLIASNYTSPLTDTHSSSTWQIASDIGFTTIIDTVVDSGTDLTSWTPTFGVAPVAEDTFFARVRYSGGLYGEGDWSQIFTIVFQAFNIVTHTPTILTTAFPKVGDTLVLTGSSFSSGATDVHGSSTWEIASDVGFGSIIDTVVDSGINLITWTPTFGTVPILDDVYYARVKYSGITHGTSLYSAIFIITFKSASTTTTIPNILTTADPKITDTLELTSTAFESTDDTHGSTTWELASDDTFTTIIDTVVDSGTDLTSWTPTFGVAPVAEDTFFARVKYTGVANGVGEWSPTFIVTYQVSAALTRIATIESTIYHTNIADSLLISEGFLVCGSVGDSGFICKLDNDMVYIPGSGIEVDFNITSIEQLQGNRYIVCGNKPIASPKDGYIQPIDVVPGQPVAIPLAGPGNYSISRSIPFSDWLTRGIEVYDAAGIAAGITPIAVATSGYMSPGATRITVVFMSELGGIYDAYKADLTFDASIRGMVRDDTRMVFCGQAQVGSTIDVWFGYWDKFSNEFVSKYIPVDVLPDVAMSIQTTSYGYLLCGFRTEVFEASSSSAGFIIKLDKSMNVIMSKFIQPTNDYINSILVSMDPAPGGYIVTGALFPGGMSNNYAVPTEDAVGLVIKLDINFNVINAVTLGVTPGNSTTAWRFNLHQNGNAVITGNTSSTSPAFRSGMLVRIPDSVDVTDSVPTGISNLDIKNHPVTLTSHTGLVSIDTPGTLWLPAINDLGLRSPVTAVWGVDGKLDGSEINQYDY